MFMSRPIRLIAPLLAYSLVLAVPAAAVGVSASRQSCIRDAMASGIAAIGNTAQLNTLYERYFVEETIARVAAGKDWMAYDPARKNAQRNRVRRFVVEALAPNLEKYGASNVKFVSESGSKVRGIITQPNGQKRTVIWDFAGPCQFVNITITGYGSLISFIGKEAPRGGK
jgi:MlaC protein